jgi:hypothetical protein
MKKKLVLFAGLMIVLLAGVAIGLDLLGATGAAQADSGSSLEVTVYNTNLGVVKDVVYLPLREGANWHKLVGVASEIDPTSVKLRSLDNSFEVLEQNYQYDLVNKQKILQKYIGEKIRGFIVVGDAKELVEGVLLSSSGNEMIIQTPEGGVQIVNLNNLLLPSLPEGLITKPTLEWLIRSAGSGNKSAELSYMTSGMSWSADYVMVANNDDTRMDLNGWVTITNNAGTTFKDANLKLVAGDVNRVTEGANRYDMEYTMAKSVGADQFAQEQLFEYHMYDLQRRTTLRDKEQKQISLLEAKDSAIEKEFIYENGQTWWGWWNYDSGDSKVQVKLNFKNSEENNLGIPLPKGRVRVFKKDTEGKLQFLGEDSIDHTPKDETLRILVGNAFDIVGERKKMDVKDLGCRYDVTWEVTLRNHKTEDVVVTVLEHTGDWDWEITSENYPHTKESNTDIKWKLPVKTDGESKLTYTVRYNYC